MAAETFHTPTPEEIMEYLDGEGAPDARAAIESHLAACTSCQALADDHRRLSREAAAWTVAPPPDTLRAPASTPAMAGARRWSPPRLMLSGLGAAAAVLIVAWYQAPQLTSLKTARAVQADGSQTIALGHQPGGAGGGRPEAAQSGLPAGAPRTVADPAAADAKASGTAPAQVRALIRTATLQLVATDFSRVRAAVEQIVESASGFADQLAVSADPGTARALRATLRVPGDRLAETLGRLRALGQVTQDQQNAQDVADQLVDLEARTKNARATEQRLIDLLRNRTGKLTDVLEVEQELSRVRLEIERLDAEKTNMSRRVAYATIDLTISEERKAGLDPGPLPLWTQIRVAGADGLQSAVDTIVGVALFALRAGPTLIIWGAVAATLWITARRVHRRRGGSPA